MRCGGVPSVEPSARHDGDVHGEADDVIRGDDDEGPEDGDRVVEREERAVI